jgi:peptidoglycan/LPS O-acetylase OafA/YrhL
MPISRVNNFDLVRLLAASQVVIAHICSVTGAPIVDALRPTVSWLAVFPGVPIFFTVSGFLIYWSFERNSDHVGSFFKNRFLRIYPGLWVCFVATLALLTVFGQLTPTVLGRADFWGWVARQVTFFQFGTPDCFRHWGDGQVNRALWTISLELQFYALVPLIYYLFNRLGKWWAIGWAALFFSSIGVYALQCRLPADNILRVVKDVGISSYLYNFLYGIAFYKSWNRIRAFVEGRCLYWLVAYVAFVHFCGDQYQVWPYSPEPVRMLGYLLLSGLTISAAFSFPSLSDQMLRGFDISYGVYIYHGLVLNCFLALGWMRRWDLAILVLPVSFAVGAISWVLVERPMLRKKRKEHGTGRTDPEPGHFQSKSAPCSEVAALTS